MAVTNKNLFEGALTAVLADTYIAPLLTTGVVKAATFTNSTSAVVALTIKIIASSSATARTVVNARNVGVNETFFASELINQAIEAQGSIQAQGLGIEVILSGVELT